MNTAELRNLRTMLGLPAIEERLALLETLLVARSTYGNLEGFCWRIGPGCPPASEAVEEETSERRDAVRHDVEEVDLKHEKFLESTARALAEDREAAKKAPLAVEEGIALDLAGTELDAHMLPHIEVSSPMPKVKPPEPSVVDAEELARVEAPCRLTEAQLRAVGCICPLGSDYGSPAAEIHTGCPVHCGPGVATATAEDRLATRRSRSRGYAKRVPPLPRGGPRASRFRS